METKFYNVKIGTNTRAGNLNVLQSFVAQSDKDINSVSDYYMSKYKGFAVSVDIISEIVADEIPKKVVTDYYGQTPEQNEIDKLRKELKNQQSKFNSFSGTINWKSISEEVTNDIRELTKIAESYQVKKNDIANKIKGFLNEKYGSVIVSSSSLQDWDHSTFDIPFTIRLKGDIKRENNIIT